MVQWQSIRAMTVDYSKKSDHIEKSLKKIWYQDFIPVSVIIRDIAEIVMVVHCSF